MNNLTLSSLCSAWNEFELPAWQRVDHGDDIKYIIELIEELTLIRTKKMELDNMRTALAKHCLRWNPNGEVKDLDFAWHCCFDDYSFLPQDASTIVKTIKTYIFKETKELREQRSFRNSDLLLRIADLPNGIHNERLCRCFTDDLKDLFLTLRQVLESSKDSSRSVLEFLLKSPNDETPDDIKEFVVTELIDPIEEILTVKQEKFMKDLEAEIMAMITSHYRLLEMTLPDYLASRKVYEGNKEISDKINALQKSCAFTAQIERLIQSAKENLICQVDTLQKIQKRRLDKGIIDEIISKDMEAWLVA